MARRVEGHPRGEMLADQPEADDQIGDDDIGAALADAGADAPRQEFGIAFDIGDEREQLFRRVGEHALFGMRRHPYPAAASCAARAARSRAKSSPAW
jgi:hypothetical protein